MASWSAGYTHISLTDERTASGSVLQAQTCSPSCKRRLQRLGTCGMSDGNFSLEQFDTEASEKIRHVMHNGEPYYSLIDVVGLLTESLAPRQYWGMLKKRLHDEGADEPLTHCLQLKIRALDGKQHETDAADVETMLCIV